MRYLFLLAVVLLASEVEVDRGIVRDDCYIDAPTWTLVCKTPWYKEMHK